MTIADAWRPRFHFTPQRNWMNDPNGLVHHAGEYHLYYQYNPQGPRWGHISWGHAVSTDLVTWQELPVAIPATDRLMAFSGSVVVDHDNTSGFAPPGSDVLPMVALFTGFDPHSRIQAQHVAYSLDRGRTFTMHAGNPVVDIGSTEFRDPKVFWHARTRRWVMVLVAALEQQVWFYTSRDLTDWKKVSSFGPAGSCAGNIWECPDLFELSIDGDASRTRWVLVVSVNHGSLWGGSGVQYFVGDFDGTHFVAEDHPGAKDIREVPPGERVADFEGPDLPAGWRIDGDAFGGGPVPGALPGQAFVSGHRGRRLMNSFHGGDASVGVLTSPRFTITHPWISFQIGGGHEHSTRLELAVDGDVVREASGDGTNRLKWRSWDVSAYQGREAVLRAVDEATGPGGHLLLDTIVMGEAPVPEPDIADIALWADHGRDFYAAVTFSGMPDGRVVWMGWMNNWEYANDLPTTPWCGQQSLPRQLDLVTTPRGLRLRQCPVREVDALVDPTPVLSASDVPARQVVAMAEGATMPGRQLRARLTLRTEGLVSPVGVLLFKGADQLVRAGYDPTTDRFFVDRTPSADRRPNRTERHEAARLLKGCDLGLEVWTDGSTLEMFADGGSVVISDLVYPDPSAIDVSLFHGPENPTIRLFEVRAVAASMAARVE